MSSALPEYSALSEFLLETGAYLDATELHGLLCGFISGGMSDPNKTWLDLLLASASANRRIELEAAVRSLFATSLGQLRSFGFDFDLLLPKKEADQGLHLISSLSKWSENFMLGFGIAEALMRSHRPKLDQDSLNTLKEAKEDLLKISRLYHQMLQCDEESDDEALMTLVEHVRVTVMMIFTEVNHHLKPTQH